MTQKLQLLGSIDRAAQIDERDTLSTKSALRSLGYYQPPSYGITPYPDVQLFDGIQAYQRKNKLRVDGVMKPGGETESMMNQHLAGGTRDEKDKLPNADGKTPIIKPPKVDPNMPIYKDPIPPEGAYTDPYIDEHGNLILEGYNPNLNKPIRPPKGV